MVSGAAGKLAALGLRSDVLSGNPNRLARDQLGLEFETGVVRAEIHPHPGVDSRPTWWRIGCGARPGVAVGLVTVHRDAPAFDSRLWVLGVEGAVLSGLVGSGAR